jgi:hypothetical protein
LVHQAGSAIGLIFPYSSPLSDRKGLQAAAPRAGAWHGPVSLSSPSLSYASCWGPLVGLLIGSGVAGPIRRGVRARGLRCVCGVGGGGCACVCAPRVFDKGPHWPGCDANATSRPRWGGDRARRNRDVAGMAWWGNRSALLR